MTKARSPQTFGSILRRVIAPKRAAWSKAAAHSFLQMQFFKADIRKLAHLLEKNGEGALTPEEEGELDVYRNVGVFISLMQSRARQSLKKSSARN